jgi:hypothetical protein
MSTSVRNGLGEPIPVDEGPSNSISALVWTEKTGTWVGSPIGVEYGVGVAVHVGYTVTVGVLEVTPVSDGAGVGVDVGMGVPVS